MEAELKKTLKSLSLETRHLFEGYFDSDGRWNPGDLERRINSLGIWKDKDPIPIYEMSGLSYEDKKAREVIDAYIQLRKESGDTIATAVTEFVKESAYTWTNRIFTLRCMEARGLIDEVIIQKDVYGGRSLEHNRLVQKDSNLSSGEDDGLFVLFEKVFKEQYENIPDLFDPESPAILLRPSPHVLQKYIRILSGRDKINNREYVDEEIFKAQDAMGYAYQYWNFEEKQLVLDSVKNKKNNKIEGSNIIPATALYTENYMVKFLIQNSLGATWILLHPQSKLIESMEYYVKDADRTPVKEKAVKEITFLDPAVGSGHFLLEAFDIYFQMYQDEGYEDSKEICDSILNNNLYGIDIDERSIQITRSVLYMKAAEKVYNYSGKDLNSFHDHIVATNIRLPKGKDHLEIFLEKHPEDEPLKDALIAIFEGLENVHELGSLVQIEEVVERELERIQQKSSSRTFNISTGELYKPINYSSWRNDTLLKIKQHFQEEAKRAIMSESFFSKSVVQGIEFFDLISSKYDIVAANPPYMNSGYFGNNLKKYINSHYKYGKGNIYLPFILRNIELCNENGRIAMVALHSWMFLRTYSNFRNNKTKESSKPDSYKGVLNETSIETLAHLGPNAFSEISGEVVDVAMFILNNTIPHEKHQLTAFRLNRFPNHLLKDLHLRKFSNKYKKYQKEIEKITGSPVLFWLTDELLELMAGNQQLMEIAYVGEGVSTSNNSRFIRYWWENLNSKRWKDLTKGGGYKKWDGLNYFQVDWENDGCRVKNFIIERYPYFKGNYGFKIKDEEHYYKKALTYSTMAQGTLSVRIVENSIYDNSGSFIAPKNEEDIFWIASIMNSRISSFLLRSVTQSLSVKCSYASEFILPKNPPLHLSKYGRFCYNIAIYNSGYEIINKNYSNRSYNFIIHEPINVIKNIFESKIERDVLKSYNLNSKSIDMVISETGTPLGWLPIISGYHEIPEINAEIEMDDFDVDFDISNATSISKEELISLKMKLKEKYENGPGYLVRGSDKNLKDLGKNEEEMGALIPIPPETFLEEISEYLNIHPLSTFLLIKEGMENDSWRCISEEQRKLKDQLSVLIMRNLGFVWPRQIESNHNYPNWVDEDGIIPLFSGCDEEPLYERIIKQLSTEFNIININEFEREFIRLFNLTIDNWLLKEFFPSHIKQFNKRPIVWQLTSKQKLRGQKPSFSCFILYNKLDKDTLFKLRSHYIGPLRTRYETELNMIENISQDGRSERQSNRREELIGLIEELKEFDSKVEKVTSEGFDSALLKKFVEKEKIDKWCSIDGKKIHPQSQEEFYRQEKGYIPDINDGVRVNIAPLQKAGLLAADVIAKKDLDKAISDRAEWRADERRWCREGKLPKPGWWEEDANE